MLCIVRSSCNCKYLRWCDLLNADCHDHVRPPGLGSLACSHFANGQGLVLTTYICTCLALLACVQSASQYTVLGKEKQMCTPVGDHDWNF